MHETKMSKDKIYDIKDSLQGRVLTGKSSRVIYKLSLLNKVVMISVITILYSTGNSVS